MTDKLRPVALHAGIAFLATFLVLVDGHELVSSLSDFAFWEQCLAAVAVAALTAVLELAQGALVRPHSAAGAPRATTGAETPPGGTPAV